MYNMDDGRQRRSQCEGVCNAHEMSLSRPDRVAKKYQHPSLTILTRQQINQRGGLNDALMVDGLVEGCEAEEEVSWRWRSLKRESTRRRPFGELGLEPSLSSRTSAVSFCTGIITDTCTTFYHVV